MNMKNKSNNSVPFCLLDSIYLSPSPLQFSLQTSIKRFKTMAYMSAQVHVPVPRIFKATKSAFEDTTHMAFMPIAKG